MRAGGALGCGFRRLPCLGVAILRTLLRLVCLRGEERACEGGGDERGGDGGGGDAGGGGGGGEGGGDGGGGAAAAACTCEEMLSERARLSASSLARLRAVVPLEATRRASSFARPATRVSSLSSSTMMSSTSSR